MGDRAMAGQPGFFDGDERLKALSAAGDPLERLAQVIDFEVFRVIWKRRCCARIGPRGGGRHNGLASRDQDQTAEEGMRSALRSGSARRKTARSVSAVLIANA